MRIGLDGRPMLAVSSGIGKYTYELTAALRQLPNAPEVILYYGFFWSKSIKKPDRTYSVADGSGSRLRNQMLDRMPTKFKKWVKKQVIDWRFDLRQTDLFHATNYTMESLSVPFVVTVHDLSFKRFPETHPVGRLKWLNANLSSTLRHARRIIADSQSTKEELVALMGVAADRIDVVYLGVTPDFRPRNATGLAVELRQYGLRPKGYILSVGTLEPRKNILSLLQAYERLPAFLQKRWPLVVAGMRGWKDGAISEGLSALAREGKIRTLGYVPEQKLPAIYAGAALFVYPSVYEGFGLPPLEAMASGVPTVVSNRTSLPEVVGDAGAMVDPEDVVSMAHVLESLLEDPPALKEMTRKGLARAKRFTWDACAANTLEVYRRALRQN
ncbi:MAG: glycosyltransferase family 4 protein [Desulfobacterales bacterium]|nr:MAG: glycosyltransferase family 4 protein [Desulfobacterales bacterium]